MNIQKIIIGTIVGGIVLFLAGWAIWGTGLDTYIDAHTTQYDGLKKEMPSLALMFLACTTTAFLFSVIFERWANIATPRSGALLGATIAPLMGLNAELMMLSSMNLIDTQVILVNVLGNILWGAIGGAVIGWLMGRS